MALHKAGERWYWDCAHLWEAGWSIVELLSLEIGATLLLLGAQVISEYERLGKRGANRPSQPMRT